MKAKITFRKSLLSAGLLLLLTGFSSCSNDDDFNIIIDDDDRPKPVIPTGSFQLETDEFSLTKNSFTLRQVTVGQNSWLAAVHSGNETTSDFIVNPVFLKKGINQSLNLKFHIGSITNSNEGHQVVLLLFADNGEAMGKWDTFDQRISSTATITVIAEYFTTNLDDFDIDGNRGLDANEILITYQNYFSEWDVDGDGFLNIEEFYTTTFTNTDSNDDDTVSKEEWDTGFAAMFGLWNDNNFTSFDLNSDGILDTQEWKKAFENSNWFNTYDADANALVSEAEWNAGLFSDWDVNRNGLIDLEEFNRYRSYAVNWKNVESYSFESYDLSKNGTLEFQEAVESFNFSRYFSENWDYNQDGMLNRQEFYLSFYTSTDNSNDTKISREEWNKGFTALFSKWTEKDFQIIDKDQSGLLNQNEWLEIFIDSGWFESYDTGDNDLVSFEEWRQGLFADWDINNNKLIEKDEFRKYFHFVLSWIKW